MFWYRKAKRGSHHAKPWFGKANPYCPPSQSEPPGSPALYPKRIWTEEEIFETVAGVLVDALGVDRDEVVPEASLGRDLGAC